MDRSDPSIKTSAVRLRDVLAADLPIFWQQQLDLDANDMAAFTASDPTDQAAFVAHWSRILSDATSVKQTILCDEQVAGHILSFEQFGQPAVSYWLGKPYWSKGVATRALAALLACITTRPLYARAAKDNLGSIRVLEKCGFTISGEDTGFANARGQEIEENILVLTR